MVRRKEIDLVKRAATSSTTNKESPMRQSVRSPLVHKAQLRMSRTPPEPVSIVTSLRPSSIVPRM